jgi:site-specific DNA-methyltransferase (adenine-specific)
VADACITDPPYGETAFEWDRWPTAWPSVVAAALPPVTSMWCFGSLRMFLDRARDFDGWRLAQDIVWEKHNGSGAPTPGRFLRVHEHAVQWYRGPWAQVHSAPQREASHGADKTTRRQIRASGHHRRPDQSTVYTDDGLRLPRSVQRFPAVRGGLNATQKPIGLVSLLVAQSCPQTVLDPFAGSGTTLDAARQLGLRAVGVEVREAQCEKAAQRLSALVLDGGAA